jgi:hypothetical protein
VGDVRLITVAERQARLARRHRLAPGTAAGSVAEAARSLVALHSTDPVTVYISAMRRLHAPAVDVVETALYDERSVVRHHAMRRTLWVTTPDLAPVLHASSTLALVGPGRRRTIQWMLASGLVDDVDAADRWIDEGIVELAAEIDRRGETTARELGEALPHLTAEIGLATDRSYGGMMPAHTRLLTIMGFMGTIVRGRPLGTWINSQYRWATTSRWLGAAWPELDPAAAQATLVGAYLRAFGPATTADVQWWTGWTKGATTRALAVVAAEPVMLDDGGAGWIAAGDDGATEPADPWVALLPGLDPTTMGWKERGWFLPSDLVPTLFDSNGNAGPTIWVDGRVVGGWAQHRDGTIATRVLTPVTDRQHRALDDEAERLRALLGDARFRVRFPSPLSRELAG